MIKEEGSRGGWSWRRKISIHFYNAFCFQEMTKTIMWVWYTGTYWKIISYNCIGVVFFSRTTFVRRYMWHILHASPEKNNWANVELAFHWKINIFLVSFLKSKSFPKIMSLFAQKVSFSQKNGCFFANRKYFLER